jgi:Zn-dependent membrane protease YugP
MFYLDSSFLILIPALMIAAWAQLRISTVFNKYSKIRSINGYTGEQVARMMLDSEGMNNVPVKVIGGKLTDNFDPRDNTMHLSQDVYYGNSVAAIGVAAHETGHAMQHKENYSPLMVRNAIVPIVGFSSNASWIILVLGFIMGIQGFITIGIILFTAVVAFQLITLPVEFNASKRAIVTLEQKNILYGEEIKGAKAVLSAAAMTYVAAALMAIAQLLRLLFLSRRNN